MTDPRMEEAYLRYKAMEAVRWACECARESLPTFERHMPGSRAPHSGLDAVEAWLAAPDSPAAIQLTPWRDLVYAAVTTAYQASGPDHRSPIYGAFEAAEAAYAVVLATIALTRGWYDDAEFWANTAVRRSHLALRRLAREAQATRGAA